MELYIDYIPIQPECQCIKTLKCSFSKKINLILKKNCIFAPTLILPVYETIVIKL